MPTFGATGGAFNKQYTAVSDEMAAAVGSEIRSNVSFPIDASDIRRWAVAVYWPEPPPTHFWDAEAAATSVHKGIVAPEEFNPFAWMGANGPAIASGPSDGGGGHDADATEKGIGIKGPGLKNMLNGGLEIEYGVRMRPGDVITSVTRLGGYKERMGKLGWMLFTTFEDTWTNQDGAVVKTSSMTLIRY